jgi:manganese oxidase
VTAALGLPMWLDLIVEYLAGFAFGLFIFQSLFMKSMMGGSYWENVRKSCMPEFVSMNFMMAGTAPVMSFLMMGRDMRAMEPSELLFKQMKHGVMTQREGSAAASSHRAHSTTRSAHQGHAKSAGAHRGQHSEGHQSGAGHHAMASTATRPQLAAMGGVSLLALFIGMVAPANWVNLTLPARDVGGAIMPPGMIMDRDTPAEAMIDMAAVDPRDVTAMYGLEARGDQELTSRIENGVKVFDLETSVIPWTILPGVTVDAYAFTGQIPGQRIRFREGDRVRINVTNRLPETTTVHWHGLIKNRHSRTLCADVRRRPPSKVATECFQIQRIATAWSGVTGFVASRRCHWISG